MSESKTYSTSASAKYKSEEVWFPLSEDILGWDYDFHELMLNDSIRMKSYEKAVKEVVKPGKKVVDIGTGTGILAKWALEAGAEKVYGIDVNKDRLKNALDRINEAGFGDKFQVFNALSYEVNLPEKVDLIISEILGNLGDNEDMTSILNDAKKRFLNKNGVMLPNSVQTFLVPISSISAYFQVRDKKVRGVNSRYKINNLLSKLETKNQFNIYYDAILPKFCYLSLPESVKIFRFDGNDESVYEVKTKFKILKSGKFTGFKGYFVAKLSNKTVLDISGDDIENRKTSDCWKHCYLPIETPVELISGDIIELNYSRSYPKTRNSPFRQHYAWRGKILRENKMVYTFNQGTH